MTKSSDSKSQVEYRKELRRRVLFSGVIFVPQTHATIDCSIKDLSDDGAKIIVHAQTLSPDNYLLINIKNRIAYEVQCVRRKGREMGVKIRRSISLMEATSPEALQLRRLLVERLER